MNKYLVTIPYSYERYGNLSVFIYADNEDDAMEMAYDSNNWHNENYDDGDDCGSNDYNYDAMEIELEEEETDPAEANRLTVIQQAMQLPCNYTHDLIQL